MIQLEFRKSATIALLVRLFACILKPYNKPDIFGTKKNFFAVEWVKIDFLRGTEFKKIVFYPVLNSVCSNLTRSRCILWCKLDCVNFGEIVL